MNDKNADIRPGGFFFHEAIGSIDGPVICLLEIFAISVAIKVQTTILIFSTVDSLY